MVGNCNTAIKKQVDELPVRILLIEDNLAEARLLQEFLKETILIGVRLAHVKRLKEAIASLKQESFDIILLDLTLPDSQGIESLDSLLLHAPNLPIVVLTHTNDNELAVEAVRHGAQDYLVKRQINQDILGRAVRYAIERKLGAEALREANEILEQRVQERTAELQTANQLLKHEIEQRQKVQERLELSQKVAKIGTFDWNIQTNEVAWTAELEALYGLEPGSFQGRCDRWLQTLHPDDRTQIEQEILQAIKTGRGLDTEFRIILPGGETRWIAVKSSLFHNWAQKPQRMIGIHMDITEKKQLEAQFLRAQRLESLGTLASGIAHDLNNILTPIVLASQLLALKLPNQNEQTQRKLKTLEASAQRGSELVKQILSFARGIEGQRVSLQINHVLSEIRQIIEQTIPKSIEIHTNISSDIWTICGDATQLHQVFMNLCVNARDAMPQGGDLRITAENIFIDEHYARLNLDANVGPYVVVSITDTGTGIASENLHRIFDPFFTTKEIGKGTGLGLSAVLGIVKSHGGFVDVQSEVNKGSKFKVYLPASLSTVVPVDHELELLSGQEELILVVDDEAVICEITKATLEAYNYQVLTAKDGVEALTLFAKNKDKIYGVLMDIMMPSMDGLATIPLLRHLNPHVYAVAMSGLNSTEAIASAEKLGFQAFLAKPFMTKDLLQVLYKSRQR